MLEHPLQRTELSGALRLHSRYRFDPAGLSTAQRQALREAVARWLSDRSI